LKLIFEACFNAGANSDVTTTVLGGKVVSEEDLSAVDFCA
jgi:hypothetical protein